MRTVSAAKQIFTEKLFTEREVAKLLSLSPHTIRMLRNRKQISCFKFGRRVAYAARHIEDFKQQHECQAVAPVSTSKR